MSNIQGKQAEFMVMAGQRICTLREVLRANKPNPQAELYMNLIEEEFDELQAAFVRYSNAVREDERLAILCEVLDGVADMAVVLMGLCNSLGLPFDAAFHEVHKSNMTKFAMDEASGQLHILRRADGKIIKPKDWTPPNLMSILKYKMVVGE